MTITYEWRGAFDNAEINALHAEGFDHPVLHDDDWWTQVNRHSLGWVVAREDAVAREDVAREDVPREDVAREDVAREDGRGRFVGFVNVAWDGAIHAFILDTLTASRVRRRGVGKQLVAVAVREASAAGCEWLHVDFDDHLRTFYFDACGFTPTNAGLIQLR